MQGMKVQGFRLSPQQEHLWHLQQADGCGVHAAQCSLCLEGEVDGAALRSALADVVSRHEILRTTFRQLPGTSLPVQEVGEGEAPELRCLDLTGLTPEEASEELDRLRRREARKPHSPESPLLTACLAVLPPAESVLVLTLPALCADPAGLENLSRELAVAYSVRRGAVDPRQEPIQYADVAGIFSELLEAEDTEGGRLFWQKQDITGMPTPALPFESPVGAERFLPGCVSAVLRGVPSGDLERRLLACWSILLWQSTGEPDITVGVAFDGRGYEGLGEALGLFSRHLPVRCRLDPAEPLARTLERLGEALRTAAERQEYFSWELAGGPSFPPFAFALEPPAGDHPAGEVRFRVEHRFACWDRFRLRLSCLETAAGLEARFEYDAGHLRRPDVVRLAERFQALLESSARRPGTAISELDLLGATERHRLLFELNDTAAEPPSKCLDQLVREQAERTPDAVAAVCGAEHLSYAELRARAGGVSDHLRRLGVGPEGRVALAVERSFDMVVGLLGILESGAAYVPLDPSYPKDRLALMLEDAGAQVLLTRERLLGSFPHPPAGALCLERIGRGAADAPQTGATPDGLAYLIYTSGSTGRPKGVMVSHGAIVNRLAWMARTFPVTAEDRVLQKTPFSFDASIWEIFLPLLTGARLVLAEPEGHRDAAYLLETIGEQGITVLQLVPSLLAVFLEQEGVAAGCRSLRRVFCGGEVLPGRLRERCLELLKAELCNLYGPTETAIDATFHRCAAAEGEGSAPIGRPLDNVRVFLRDAAGRPVPLGLAGELHVAGTGLARGYAGNPAATAERFVPDPFPIVPGGRLYATGDLARHLPGGELEFLGRVDQQVKLRGIRIEPGEIEAVLAQHPGVREAAVAVHATATGDRQLVAYVVPQESAARRPLHRLPNGLEVACLNAGEADLIYEEIFEDETYLAHGIRLGPGDCVFDVGANIGLFSLFVSQRFPGVRLYAFEPIPPTFEILRANARLYGLDARLFDCGLSDRNGTADFTFYPHWSAMSGAYADAREEGEVSRAALRNRGPLSQDEAEDLLADRFRVREVFPCALRTLSDVIRREGVERIDLLKIDAEKSEADVLGGLADEDWVRVGQLVVEVHDRDGRLDRLRAQLEARGFAVVADQDRMLRGTGIYNLYARHPERVARREAERAGPSDPAPPLRRTGVTPEALSAFLAERLPEPMLPAGYVVLPSLPRLPNGKLDRRALPDPHVARRSADVAPAGPQTPIQEALLEIWNELLQAERIGIHDDFFALGGSSLVAMRVVSRIWKSFGIQVRVRDLFAHPTIEKLAARLEDEILASSADAGLSELLDLLEGAGGEGIQQRPAV